jgi:hypothetical protein
MNNPLCKVCGRRDKFDFHVPDELWNQIVPLPYENSVVCLTCFDNFAFTKRIQYAASLRVLYFVGDQAILTFRQTDSKTPN